MYQRAGSVLWIVTLAIGSVAAGARADDLPCPPSTRDRVIEDNVVVQGSCTLDAVTVRGNVRVERNGRLQVVNGTRIDGNIQAADAESVRVVDAFVDGAVQLDRVRGRIDVLATRVTGNVQLKDNRNGAVVRDTTVDGDMQAFDNRQRLQIVGNTIDGNLQCKSNEPRPDGGRNRVRGNREDQCADL